MAVEEGLRACASCARLSRAPGPIHSFTTCVVPGPGAGAVSWAPLIVLSELSGSSWPSDIAWQAVFSL